MSKSIYEKALGILKNRVSKLHINHKIGNKDIAKLEILDIAKAIENHVMPIFEQAITELEQTQKQEKLLEKLAERDTPMLPIKLKWKNTENYYYVCPKCEEMVARDDEVFCQDCGQRLEWEEEIK